MKVASTSLGPSDDEPYYLIIHNPYPKPKGFGDKMWDNVSQRFVCQWLCSFMRPEDVIGLYTRKRPTNTVVLAEVSNTVDLSLVLGAHWWSTFDRSVPRGSPDKSCVFLCRADTLEEAVTKPGWESGAILPAFLNNLTRLDHLRNVNYPKPRRAFLKDCFGPGDPSWAKENPPVEGQEEGPPFQAQNPPPPRAPPKQQGLFRDPRYKDFPPFQAAASTAEKEHTPSMPERSTPDARAGEGSRSIPGTPQYTTGSATPQYMGGGTSAGSVAGSATPLYNPQVGPSRGRDGSVPPAFPTWPTSAPTTSNSPPTARSAYPSKPSTPASTPHSAHAAPASASLPTPLASTTFGTPPPSTLSTNTGDLGSRNAQPSRRDPRLRTQGSTPNSSRPPPEPIAEASPPPTTPYASPISERARSVTPFTRSQAPTAAASRLPARRGLFGVLTPAVPPPSDGITENVTPPPAQRRSQSTISSSFPTPPPEPEEDVKIEALHGNLQEDEEDVKPQVVEGVRERSSVFATTPAAEADEEDIKPRILPNGEAVDPESMTGRQIERQGSTASTSQSRRALKMEPVKKEEHPEIVPVKSEVGINQEHPCHPAAPLRPPAHPALTPASVKTENHDLEEYDEHPTEDTTMDDIPAETTVDEHPGHVMAHPPHPGLRVKHESNDEVAAWENENEWIVVHWELLPSKAVTSIEEEDMLDWLREEDGGHNEVAWKEHIDLRFESVFIVKEEQSSKGGTGLFGDDDDNDWIVVHWELIPSKDLKSPEAQQERLAWLRDSGANGGHNEVAWKGLVEITFELVIIPKEEDIRVPVKSEVITIEEEADNFLNELALELNMSTKRKREEEDDKDFVKRHRAEQVPV